MVGRGIEWNRIATKPRLIASFQMIRKIAVIIKNPLSLDRFTPSVARHSCIHPSLRSPRNKIEVQAK